MPSVSIVMPAYNSEDTISSSIESVLNQSFCDFELIICDDGSSDATVEIVNKYVSLDRRIKLVDNEFYKGAAGARNSCLSRASFDYIAFLDSDDLWHKDKLKVQVEYMRANDIAASYGDYSMFYENIDDGKVISTPDNIVFRDIVRKCDIGCLTVMIDKKLVKEFFFPNIAKEDYALWVYLCNNGFEFKRYPGCLAYYRKQESSSSSSKLKEIPKQWNVLKNIAKINFIHRLYCISIYVVNGVLKHKRV